MSAPRVREYEKDTFARTAAQGAAGALRLLDQHPALAARSARRIPQTSWEYMNATIHELIVLAGLSAAIGALALASENYVATAVFAALTCTIGQLTVVTRNLR
jgi:hypothetical protein